MFVVGVSGMILAQQPAAGPYTAQQAAAGQASYQANCAGCHQQNLSGSGDAPPLRGTQFVTNWGQRTTRELLSFMQLTMPPAGPGGMSADEYAGIVAFILQSNGVPAGTQALTASVEVRINSLPIGTGSCACSPGCRSETIDTTQGNHGEWRGERLHPRHTRDAARSQSKRLADDPPRLSR